MLLWTGYFRLCYCWQTKHGSAVVQSNVQRYNVQNLAVITLTSTIDSLSRFILPNKWIWVNLLHARHGSIKIDNDLCILSSNITYKLINPFSQFFFRKCQKQLFVVKHVLKIFIFGALHFSTMEQFLLNIQILQCMLLWTFLYADQLSNITYRGYPNHSSCITL